MPILLKQESIEEIAERYLQYIEQVCPKGPIELIASCGAAVLAIEVAQALSVKNRRPQRLILMDLPGGELIAPLHLKMQERQKRSWRSSLFGFIFRQLGGERLQHVSGQRHLEKKITMGQTLNDNEARSYTDYLLNAALRSYCPKTYNGAVELVYSGRWSRGVENAEDAKLPTPWQGIFTQLKGVHFSPAKNHEDLLSAEGASFISTLLKPKQGT
jgi:thioesterase domain-containing protein